MSNETPETDQAQPEQPRQESRWQFVPRTRAGKMGHLLFWTALFYGLAWGFATLAEWLSP